MVKIAGQDEGPLGAPENLPAAHLGPRALHAGAVEREEIKAPNIRAREENFLALVDVQVPVRVFEELVVFEGRHGGSPHG